jgi:hypothetical protein
MSTTTTTTQLPQDLIDRAWNLLKTLAADEDLHLGMFYEELTNHIANQLEPYTSPDADLP